MKRIIIVGGGFGGISALKKLYPHGRDIDIVLIDKKDEFNFLPMIPDVIGRGIKPEHLSFGLKRLCRRLKVEFIKSEVTRLDLENKSVYSSTNSYLYDYLIIASGSETNFYGNNHAEKYGFRLDTVSDSKKIFAAIKQMAFESFIISGGGYTGIEAATNLRRYLSNNNILGRIIIVEKTSGILGPLPDWMKEYTYRNLKKLKIETFSNCLLSEVEGKKITLSSGEVFNNAMLIWTAGVKTANFIFNLNRDKTPQGRLKVDKFLRLTESCFVVGDANSFSYQGGLLRMAVQFSIAQGEIAAVNIIKSIYGAKLKEYKPLDLGYIIPMANNASCGRVFGFRFKGVFATILHYLMCIFRSYGFSNKLGILIDLLKGGVK